MNHPSDEAIRHADEAVFTHLETCERCRVRIRTDVDLDRAWRRVVAGVESEPVVRPARIRRRWAVVVTAVIGLVALIMPFALIGSNPGGDTAGVTEDTEALPPSVVLPERGPEPAPEDTAPPAVPTADPDRPAFEISFRVGDDIVGRLIWARSDFYELVRGNLIDDGAEYDYGTYRSGDTRGFSDPDNSTLDLVMPDGRSVRSVVTDSPEVLTVVPDPEIPWSVLIEPMDDTATWSALVDEGVEPVETAPTHALAERAWASDGARLELTADGIPVLIDRPGHDRFEVVTLDRRVIRSGEVGNNTDLPFDYAVFLSADAPEAQLSVLSDGIVTFSDYRSAAEAAARCAGVEPSFDETAGMYEFADDPITSACVERYVDSIAAVWRVDSQLLDTDEWAAIYYTVQGEPDAVVMYRSEEGPEMALASGDAWAISIGERGPGLCTRTSWPNSYSEGCFVPSQMPLPGRLGLDEGWSFDDGQPTQGALLGIVEEGAERLVIEFSLGVELEVVTGDRAVLGFRGFGMLYDVTEMGVPIMVTAMSGAEVLFVYETGHCSPGDTASVADIGPICP